MISLILLDTRASFLGGADSTAESSLESDAFLATITAATMTAATTTVVTPTIRTAPATEPITIPAIAPPLSPAAPPPPPPPAATAGATTVVPLKAAIVVANPAALAPAAPETTEADATPNAAPAGDPTVDASWEARAAAGTEEEVITRVNPLATILPASLPLQFPASPSSLVTVVVAGFAPVKV